MGPIFKYLLFLGLQSVKKFTIVIRTAREKNDVVGSFNDIYGIYLNVAESIYRLHYAAFSTELARSIEQLFFQHKGARCDRVYSEGSVQCCWVQDISELFLVIFFMNASTRPPSS